MMIPLIVVMCLITVFGYSMMGVKALVIPFAFFISYWAVLKPLFHIDIDWRE